ncbi:MAG TPA: DUF4287 domain-containing protein [Flavipsychrobacter sp.]
MDANSMEQSMVQNLEKKTGKPLAEWIEIVNSTKLQKHTEIVNFLKTEHGFTHGFANMVALKARGTDAGSAANTDDLVTAQYKGKETLRPMYDKLIKEIQKFGRDVEVAPKNAYVSIRRKKQFAILQPSTKTRLDVGINLKGTGPTGKLEKSGSFNTMVSHRVRVEKPEDVDKDLFNWLKQAYDAAG